MEQAAKQIDVVKVDVDKDGATAQHFGVRGIPYLIVIKDGKAAGRIQPTSADQIVREFQRYR